MAPTFNSNGDFVGIGGPYEGFWFVIGFRDEAVDSGLEVDEGMEDASFEATPGKFGEKTFNRIEP